MNAGGFGVAPGAFVGTGTAICPGCGAIAPRSRTSCVLCNTPFGTPRVVPGRPDGNYWACIVECDFACRGCGLRSPLDGLDLDGEVECRRCGLAQKFDIEQWEEALGFAQDVADCAGPQGRRPPFPNSPYASLGESNTYAEKTLTGMVIDGEGMKPRSLRVKVTTGHPLCERCKQPLEVETDGYGRARTTCPSCREQAVYALPDNYDDVNADLAAVIADDHRTDRPPARVQSAPGGAAVAVLCPQCNAALPASNATMIQCQYCGTAARIPAKMLWRTQGAQPQPRRFWVLFDDDSPMRCGAGDDDDDDDDDVRELLHEASHSGDDRMARVHEAQAAQARAEQLRKVAQSAGKTNAIVGTILSVVIFGVVSIVGFSIWSSQRHKKNETTDETDTQQSKTDDAKKTATASAKKTTKKLDRDAYHDLKGCTCKVGSDLVTLGVHLDAEATEMVVGKDDQFVTKLDLSWILDSGSKGWGGLSASGGSSPPKLLEGRALGIGVACQGDTFAVVTRDRASAWSIADRKLLWDAKLSAPYAVTSTPAKKGFNVDCDVVPMQGNNLKIPLAGGKTQTLKMGDGTAVK